MNNRKIVVGPSVQGATASRSRAILLHELRTQATSMNIILVEQNLPTALDQSALVISKATPQMTAWLTIIDDEKASCPRSPHDPVDDGTLRIVVRQRTTQSPVEDQIEVNEASAQHMVATHMLAKLEPGARAMILTCTGKSEVDDARLAGWRRATAHATRAQCIELGLDCDGEHGLRELSAIRVGALLAEGMINVGDVLISTDDLLAMGAVDALRNAGLTNKVSVSAVGASPEVLLAIARGELVATVRFDPAEHAALALQRATGQYSALGPTPLCVAPSLVTKENVVEVLRANAVSMAAQLVECQARAITESRTARFMEAALDNLPCLVFIKDANDLRYRFVNKERARFMGVARDAIIGKTNYDLHSEELAHLYTERDRQVLATGRMNDIAPMISPSGELRYLLTYKIPLVDTSGKPEFLLGAAIDVTEREQAERALAERNGELERAHVSLKENQHKLLVSEQMAALGRLTAGIAHEMHSPLAAIRAAMNEMDALIQEYQASIGDPTVEAADHEEIAKEMQRCIELSRKAAERAANIVRSVKQHTRDLSHHDKERFNAVEITRDSLFLLDHAIKNRRCHVAFTASQEYIGLLGPPGGFSQIVTNLVNNALEACPDDGSGRVQVTLADTAGELVCRISDNGHGISSSVIDQIFRPMFTTKPFGKGTGLGLSIVHEIVHNGFNGSISVESQPSSGALFVLRMPLATSESKHNGT